MNISILPKILLAFAAVATLVLTTGSANAVPIDITSQVDNASFESGTADWSNVGARGTRGGVAGISPTDGSTQMWVNINGTVYQETGETIVAGTEYTLSIEFNPDQVNFGSGGNDQETVFARLYGSTAGYTSAFNETQELGPSGTVTSAVNGTQWDTVTVSFTATGAEAGQELGVAFGVTGSEGIQSEWDNVRLFAEPAATAEVPEPASIAIWSLLGLCLAGYGYRRRRKQ